MTADFRGDSLSFKKDGAGLGAMVLCALLVVGCAPAVKTESAQFEVAGGMGRPAIRVDRPVIVRLATGYSRTLEPTMSWRVAGRVAQGAVLQPVGSVFSIEGRQVHEAWLVVRGQQLVGFYLPAESRYAPLEAPVPLPIPPQ